MADQAGEVFATLKHDVYSATFRLINLLQGMELVRSTPTAKHEIGAEPAPGVAYSPQLSYVDVPMLLAGADLRAVLGPAGTVEQIAFKGWMVEVYSLWEDRNRNALRDALRDDRREVLGDAIKDDVIRPEMDVWGDFRRIRNDMVHNGSIASDDETGKCKVLRWFEPGDQIALNMKHVYDFLNQLAWMVTTFVMHPADGSIVCWFVDPGMKGDLMSRPVPQIASLRVTTDVRDTDGSRWYVASVVFENGLFTHIPIGPDRDGVTPEQAAEFIGKTRIDQDGNLQLGNGSVIARESLYQGVVDAIGRDNRIDGLGLPGPRFRFRR